MRGKSVRRIIAFIFIGVFIAMVGDRYIRKLEIEKKTEVMSTSEKKKDSIFLGRGKNITNTSLEYYGSNYYVAYNNMENLVLLKLDEKGNEINNISIKEKNPNIKDINILNNQGELYLTYIIKDKNNSNFKVIKLDDNLNHLSIDQIEDVDVSCKINSSLIALSHDSRMSIINLSTNSLEYSIDNISVKEIKSVKTDNGELVVYSSTEGMYYYLMYNDGLMEAKPIVDAGTLVGMYDSMKLAYNDENIYLVFEGLVNNEEKMNYVVKYSIKDEKVIENNQLAFNDDKKLGDIWIYFEKNKPVLIGEVENKNKGFSIGKIEIGENYSLSLEEEIASGAKGYSYIKVEDDLVIYAEHLDNQMFNINLFFN